MTDHSDQMHDIVGRLGNLEGTMQTFMRQWEMQDQTATAGRRVMHDRLELVSNQITRIATDVQNVQQDVAELRHDLDEKVMPKIEEREQVKQQKIGAKGVWAMIIGSVATVVSVLAYIADKLLGHKP